MDEQQLQQSVDELKEYLEQYGKTAEYFVRKGHLLAQIGDYEQAVAALKEVPPGAPEYLDALLEMGTCYMAQNHLTQALLSFGFAARTLRADGHPEEASALARSVLEIDQLSQGGARFFRDVADAAPTAFVLLGAVPYDPAGHSRGEELANALVQLGHTVRYVNPPLDLYSGFSEESAMLYAMLRDSYSVNGLTVYPLGAGTDALVALLDHFIRSDGEQTFLCFTSLPDDIAYNLGSRYCFVVDESRMETPQGGESKTSDCAGLITCASAALFLKSYFLEQNPNVLYLPSGVNEEPWPALVSAEEPEAMDQIPHPRIGYVGPVDERLDSALLAELAQRHPEWSFVLAGPGTVLQDGTLPANVYRVDCPSDKQLLRILPCMDVGMLPCRTDAEQQAAFLEHPSLGWYLASQIPVVSTPLPECYLNKPWVSCAAAAEEFAQCISAALTSRQIYSPVEHSNALADHAWLTQAARLVRCLSTPENPLETVEWIRKCLVPVYQFSPAAGAVYRLSCAQQGEELQTDTSDGADCLGLGTLEVQAQWKQIRMVGRAVERRKQDANLRLVVITGYFGGGNFGDELLLHTLLEKIAQLKHIVPVVIGENPVYVEQNHGVPALHFRQRAAIVQLIQACDAVILGPGGIIQSGICAEYYKNLLIYGQFSYLYPAKLAREQGKTVLCVGVGADYLEHRNVQKLMQQLLGQSPLLWLRDENSRENFVRMGLENASMYPDFSFLCPEGERKKNVLQPLAGRRPRLGVNLRCWNLENLDGFVGAVLGMYQRGWDIDLICAETREDQSALTQLRRQVLQQLGAKAEKRIRLIPFDSLSDTLEAIAQTDLMIAMRLHIGLLAAQMDIPTLFLCYDDKVTSAAKLLGVDAYALNLDQCTAPVLIKRINILRRDAQKVSAVLEQSCCTLRSCAMDGYQKLQAILSQL